MKAILLDWDGVLCDSRSLYYDLYLEATRLWDKKLPINSLEEFQAWYNPRWEENYYEMGFSADEFQEVQIWADKWLDYSKAPLFPGITECLRNWSAIAPLAIVSTTNSRLIRQRMREETHDQTTSTGTGLESYFKHFTGGEDGSSAKRDKVASTLKILGVTQGVMVGDTPLDVDAGQFNKLKTVGVTYGWVSRERMYQARPDFLVHHPQDLYQAVLDSLA